MPFHPFTKLHSTHSPAPFIHAKFHKANDEIVECNMLIDTGAFRSALPKQFVEDNLGKLPIKHIKALNFNGDAIQTPLYVVTLIIDELQIKDICVAGTRNPNYGLVGRDILSRFELHYDGPEQRFELEKHP